MIRNVLLLSLACAGISTTITEMEIFKGVREWIKSKSTWLGKLFSCGYCMSHWIAFGLVIVYQPRLYYSHCTIVDYFLTVIVISWLASFQWVIMMWLFGKAGK